MIRRLTALITALVALVAANAGNRVTLTDAAGTPGSEAVVKVNLENDPGAMAMQLNIPIPEGTEYVDGSCTITGNRLAGHTVSAAVNGGKLVVLVYSTGLAEIPSGNDDVLQFTLRLGNDGEARRCVGQRHRNRGSIGNRNHSRFKNRMRSGDNRLRTIGDQR